MEREEGERRKKERKEDIFFFLSKFFAWEMCQTIKMMVILNIKGEKRLLLSILK